MVTALSWSAECAARPADTRCAAAIVLAAWFWNSGKAGGMRDACADLA